MYWMCLAFYCIDYSKLHHHSHMLLLINDVQEFRPRLAAHQISNKCNVCRRSNRPRTASIISSIDFLQQPAVGSAAHFMRRLIYQSSKASVRHCFSCYKFFLIKCSRRRQTSSMCRHLANSTHNVVLSFDPLHENMTSFTKPEVHNILHWRQRRTEPQP